MALINCPNCNKEISDKAKVCVGCGHQIIDDVNGITLASASSLKLENGSNIETAAVDYNKTYDVCV